VRVVTRSRWPSASKSMAPRIRPERKLASAKRRGSKRPSPRFLRRRTPPPSASTPRSSDLFEKRQWPHFCSLVLVYALAHGRRNIHHLNQFLQDKARRQRRQDFLVESPWDGQCAVQTFARVILETMVPQAGE